jgi:hypothetical protein
MAGMSALVQRQTLAVHQPMSALPPKRDMKVATSTALFVRQSHGPPSPTSRTERGAFPRPDPSSYHPGLIALRHSKSGHVQCNEGCPLWAKSGHSASLPYSMISSARPDKVSGTVMPSALAVFKLMYSSTLVPCCTGNSAGFSPLRIRAT